MATFETIGREYAKELLESKEAKATARRIVDSINSLTYTTGGNLNDQDKKKILDTIRKEISALSSSYGKFILKEASLDSYNDLVDSMYQLLFK